MPQDLSLYHTADRISLYDVRLRARPISLQTDGLCCVYLTGELDYRDHQDHEDGFTVSATMESRDDYRRLKPLNPLR